MEFEDILKDVGDFGLYQKCLLFIFLVLTNILLPFFSMNAIFVSSTPDHWCNIPEIDSFNLSIKNQHLIRPPSDPYCTRYDVNFTDILQSGNLTINNNEWPVKKCDMGWRYDTTNYDETAVTKWDLVCEADYYKSMIVSFVFLGVIIGSPIYGILSDRWGRKPTFLGLALLVTVSEIGSAFCPYFSLFLILRIFIGSTMTSLYTVCYIIVLELVRPDLRARINGIATTGWTVGLCLLALIAYLTRSWFYLTIVTAVASSCFLLFFRLLPESPSWLISQERYEEAAEIMGRISELNGSNIPKEQLLQNIQNLGKKKKEMNIEKNSPMDFFKYPVMRKRFFLCMVVWFGVSCPYYGLQVNVTNLYGNEFFNYFLLSVVEIPAHLVIWWLLNNVGRRKSVQFGFSVVAISCLVPAFFPQDFERLGVVVSIIAKAGAGAAFMAQYQLCPELFPTSLRGVAMGWTSTIGTGSTLVVPYIVQLEKYGSYIPFLIFFMITVISCTCVSFLPETLKENLPQTVDDVEKNGKNEKCFSCGWTENEQYDLERKLSSSLPGTIPPFIISKELNRLPSLTITKN